MSDLLEWAAVEVNRRRFLKRLTGLAFGLFAGAAMGIPELALAAGCTGPFGSGACYSANCNGPNCQNGGGVVCSNVGGFCDDDACWTSGAHTCCDCVCRVDVFVFYCYCHG